MGGAGQIKWEYGTVMAGVGCRGHFIIIDGSPQIHRIGLLNFMHTDANAVFKVSTLLSIGSFLSSMYSVK